jgi:hypothetical protein
MRSKYSVTNEARIANGVPTINIHGVAFEKESQFAEPIHTARLTDEQLAEFWPRISNEPLPELKNVSGLLASGVHLTRFTHRPEAYTVATVHAHTVAALVAGGAEQGVKPQPAVAG